MQENIAPDTGPGRKSEPEFDRKARFAQRASVSVHCVDNWIRDRRIPFLKIGRTVLIPWREALETLSRNYRLNPRGEQEGPIKRALQLMEGWLNLPEDDYNAAVSWFAKRMPPDELLEAVLIAQAKRPEGGRRAFKYFCGVCHRKIEERRIRLSWK